jgi:AhpD family alkylhydroperoxidase
MSTVPVTAADQENTDPRVKAVFDDIRQTRGSDFINNFWLYLAFDPELLERTWSEVKQVMVVPSELDPMTKELIYAAVSIANSCTYCVHSHTAAARAKGMSDGQYADFLRVVSLAAKTNHLVTGLQVPVDDAFNKDAG